MFENIITLAKQLTADERLYLARLLNREFVTSVWCSEGMCIIGYSLGCSGDKCSCKCHLDVGRT